MPKIKLLACTRCGISFPYEKFYSSKNPKNEYTHKIPICKDCVGDMYTKLLTESGDRKEAVVKLCSALDLVFSERMFQMAENTFATKDVDDEKSIAGIYISFINGIQGKKSGENFSSSEFFDRLLEDKEINTEKLQIDINFAQEEIKNLKEQNSLLRAENNDVLTTITKVTSDLHAAKNKNEELTNTNAQLKDTNKRITDTLTEVANGSKRLEDSNKNLTRDSDNLRNENAKLQSRITSAESKIATLEISLREEVSRKENLKLKLNTEIDRLSGEQTSAKERIANLTRELKDATSTKELRDGNLTKDLKCANEELDSLKREFNKDEMNDLKVKNSNLMRELDEARQLLKKSNIDIDTKSEIPESYIFEWGKGFSLEDYEFLNKRLAVWKETHDITTESKEMLLHEIVVGELLIRRKRELGESANDEIKSVNSLINTGEFVDKKKSNQNNGGRDSFGEWIRDIEMYSPAEWYQDQKKFKDIDGIQSYIKKYIIRPLKNFVTGSRDFDSVLDDLPDGDADEK